MSAETLTQVTAERDAAAAQRDALATVARRYVVATDAFLADACAGERDHAAALIALVAALAGCP